MLMKKQALTENSEDLRGYISIYISFAAVFMRSKSGRRDVLRIVALEHPASFW